MERAALASQDRTDSSAQGVGNIPHPVITCEEFHELD